MDEMNQEDIMPVMEKSTTFVDIPKDQAQKLRIGQAVTYTVTGKVKGIHEKGMPVKPNESEKFGVDIEVDELKLQGNTADVDYANLKEAE